MSTIAERMGVTENERRRLQRWECGWCTQSLASETCGAIWDRCTKEQRHERRQRCLASLKKKPLKAVAP